MSIKNKHKGHEGHKGPNRLGMVGVMIVAACLSAACSAVDAPGTGGGQQTAAAPAGTPAPAASLGPAAAEPKTVADVFPAGAQREAVLNNCGSCHNVACAAIGQRSSDRWEALKEGHKDKVSGADLNGMFEYLKANFNADRPEPRIPPRFLEGGCTPF